MVTPRGKKAVVVTFGGGARDDETFMPDGQENIPHLLNELIPQSTFFTQVVNRGILGHYVATASIVTGAYETFNNFASVSPGNPTVFEYFRRDLKRPASDCWVVAPSNGFARIGESAHKSFGPGLGAGVILPKRLLSAALSAGADGERYQHLLRDNYETPLYAPTLAGRQIELKQMAEVLKLSVDDFAAHARSLASPDEMSVYIARHLMRQLSPSLLWVTLARYRRGAFGHLLALYRRHTALRPSVRRTVARDSEGSRVRESDHDVYPAGFRPRFRYRFGRQRLPASPHGRPDVAHHLDAGAWARASARTWWWTGRWIRPI